MRAGKDWRLGKGIAWLRTKYALVDSADASDMARLVGLIDTLNGVAPHDRAQRGDLGLPKLGSADSHSADSLKVSSSG